MCPSGRYLYANVRAWPDNCVASVEQAPPIATEIEMHEIDLVAMEKTGRVS